MKDNMNTLFKVGDMIFGFCNGFFGRDDYNAKICVYVTPFYAVFEYMERSDGATVLNVSNIERFQDIKEDIEKWKIEEKL